MLQHVWQESDRIAFFIYKDSNAGKADSTAEPAYTIGINSFERLYPGQLLICLK